MIVMVTGSSGFVGGHVLAHLAPRRPALRLTQRNRAFPPLKDPNIERFVTGDLLDVLENEHLWMNALEGAETVIHLAAAAHADPGGESGEAAIYRVNAVGTEALARYAAKAGVRRFVFLSSVKALGEWTAPGEPFTERSAPRPEDIYGQAKRRAELALEEAGAKTGMETVIIRPPLVYGEGVGANMGALIAAVKKGRLLPFSRVHNQRSLIYAGNLASAVAECAENPAAAGEAFMVSDGIEVSTPELIQAIAQALGVSPRLAPAPLWALRLAGAAGDMAQRISGIKAPVNSGAIRRLTESLTVDIGHIKTRLGWTPPYTFQEGIRRTAAIYKRENNGAGGQD